MDRILGGYPTGIDARSAGEGQSRDRLGILHRERQAEKRRQRPARAEPRLGGPGLGQRPFGARGDEGVERAVQRVDRGETVGDQFGDRDFALADHLPQPVGRERGQPGTCGHGHCAVH